MFVVKVPGVNSNLGSKGCEKAGNEILKFLKEAKVSNELGEQILLEKLDLEEIHLDNADLKLTNKLIYKNALEIFETKPKTIFLGGDHSISCSICKAFLDYSNENSREPCLIIFDAHPDCKIYNKKEDFFPENRTWLRKLIEQGFPTNNILLIGVRNLDKDEKEFLKSNQIRNISINSLLENIEETCEIVMEFSDRKDLYLSLDIDVVDPVFAPGSENLEIGGLTSREFIYLIQRLNKIKHLRAIDLVEINPLKDKGNLTVMLGAKILSELI